MSIPPLPSFLEQLLWFVRIVEAGSFSEAARRSKTSTRAMSKADSRLYAVRLDKRPSPHRVQVVQEFIVELTRAWHDVFTASGTALAGARRP